MLYRFRGEEILQKEDLNEFRSSWSKNKLTITDEVENLPASMDLTFIDQIVFSNNNNNNNDHILKEVPNHFYKIAKNIYQRKLVSCVLTGGLGNRMYQLNIALWYAQKTSKTAVIALNQKKICQHSKINYIDTVFTFLPLVDHFPADNIVHFKEKEHEYALFYNWPEVNAHVLFEGYFQNHNYVKSEIFQKYFNVQETKNYEDFAFIHVRRGDYLTLDMYVKLCYLYYLKCIFYLRQTNPTLKIIVLSDDIDWCIKRHIFSEVGVIDEFGSKEWDELKTLSVMKSCKKGSICSNSTFALWGSFLSQTTNNNYVPKKWLTNEWQTHHVSETSQTMKVVDNMELKWVLPIYNLNDDNKKNIFHNHPEKKKYIVENVNNSNFIDHFLKSKLPFALVVCLLNDDDDGFTWTLQNKKSLHKFLKQNLQFDFLTIYPQPVITSAHSKCRFLSNTLSTEARPNVFVMSQSGAKLLCKQPNKITPSKTTFFLVSSGV